jgi:hypothetical protein
VSRVRENRTHGSTGGDWKRSTLAREAKKNSRAGNSSAHMALRPTAKICHRASPRPYVVELGWGGWAGCCVVGVQDS